MTTPVTLISCRAPELQTPVWIGCPRTCRDRLLACYSCGALLGHWYGASDAVDVTPNRLHYSGGAALFDGSRRAPVMRLRRSAAW